MKTIRLCFSAFVVVGLTIFFANCNVPVVPPSHVEAVQAAAKIQAEKVAALPPKASQDVSLVANTASPVPEVPKPPDPAPVLTDHEQLMESAGISQADWGAADDIITKESGWCPTKWEGEHACTAYHGVPDNIGYGLCQATPGYKMVSIDPDWATNAVKQLEWCNNYAQAYGSWGAAKEFRDCLGSCYSLRTGTTVYKATTWF